MRSLPPGIRLRRTALCAYVKVGSHQVQRSFPRETPILDVLVWREEARQRLTLQHGSGVGSLAGDIGRYLSAQTTARRKSAEGWLAKWAKRFGNRRRASLSYEELRDALFGWQTDGYSPSSLNKLRSYFISVWRYCEGSNVRCPMLAVRKFREPAPTPRAVDPALWDRAFAVMQDTRSKARLLMIRHTGARPCEVARLAPSDMHLDDAVPWVFFTTGKDGDNRVVPLNRRGLAAARLFVELAAFGTFSKGSIRKVLLRACKRAGMSTSDLIEGTTARGQRRWRLHPYVARHQCLTELRRAGADLADVQAIAGHKSPITTARYAPAVFEKLAAAMRRVEVEAGQGD
jgi:integrase